MRCYRPCAGTIILTTLFLSTGGRCVEIGVYNSTGTCNVDCVVGQKSFIFGLILNTMTQVDAVF